MIGFSTLTLDINGTLIADELPSSDYRKHKRRVKKTATLDGGVVVEDQGYVDMDRVVSIDLKSSKAIYDRLRYYIQNYSELGLSTQLGYNTAAIKSMSDSDGKINIQCELIS